MPTSRGFDEFYGFYGGFEDHYSHVSEATFCGAGAAGCWFDLRNGTAPANRSGEYALDVVVDAAVARLAARDAATPFFAYVAVPTVHLPR